MLSNGLSCRLIGLSEDVGVELEKFDGLMGSLTLPLTLRNHLGTFHVLEQTTKNRGTPEIRIPKKKSHDNRKMICFCVPQNPRHLIPSFEFDSKQISESGQTNLLSIATASKTEADMRSRVLYTPHEVREDHNMFKFQNVQSAVCT